MQQVMAAVEAQVPVVGTATGHVIFQEAISQGSAGLVSKGGLRDSREQRLGQAFPMET